MKTHTELRGRGWSLTIQRWRSVPVPGLSSNLGVAPLVTIRHRNHTRRVATRLAEGERLWVAVVTSVNMRVSGTLADGRALAGTRIEEPHGGTVIHCLSRIADEVEQGIGPHDLPILGAFETRRNSLSLLIGDRTRLWLNVVSARDFDEVFGYFSPTEVEPSVYAGWRLP